MIADDGKDSFHATGSLATSRQGVLRSRRRRLSPRRPASSAGAGAPPCIPNARRET